MATLTQNVTTIVGTFEDIRDAIEDKGGTVSGGVENYAAAILDIPQSGGGGVIDAATDWGYMFSHNKRLNLLSDPNLNTSNVTNWDYAFSESNNSSFTSVSLNMSAATSTRYMFDRCRRLTAVNLSNTNNITSSEYMFYYCDSLGDTTLSFTGLSGNVDRMFYNAGKSASTLTIALPASFNGNSIFRYTYFGKIHITTSTKFLQPGYIVQGSSSLTEITGLDFSEATTYNSAFSGCSNLVTISFAANSTINDNSDINFSACTSLSNGSVYNILDALATRTITSTTRTCTLPTGKMPSISELTARYDTDFDTATNKLKGWTLSPTPT